MGLYKRGKVWWMSFPNKGRQDRRSCETGDKKVAEKIYHKVMTEIAEGRWLDKPIGSEKTFREMMERYDKECFSGMASAKKCGSYLNGLVEFFGDYKLDEVTPRLIKEFKLMRKAQGVKPATINRQITIAKRAYSVAIREWEWIEDNPYSRVSSEKGAGERDRWLSYEEEERLLAVSPQWLKEFVTFATWTGIREGNIINLVWSQVNMADKVIYLPTTKNGDPLVIPMMQKVHDLLSEKKRVRYLNHDLVFTSPKGKAIEPNNLRRAFRKALDDAGLSDFKPHDLRHTYGTRLAQEGFDIYAIAKLLGHKDIRMTQRYAHHSTKSLRRVVDAFESQVITNLSQSVNPTTVSDM